MPKLTENPSTALLALPIGNYMALTAMLLVAMLGASVLTLLPLWVGTMTDELSLSHQQVGFLASADMVGIFIASTSAFFWVRRVSWRLMVVLGLALFGMANTLSIQASEFETLYLLRVVAGLGCGIAYAVSLAALGDTDKPDWSFGLMVTAQVGFGFLGFEFLPKLIASGGFNMFFHYLNGWIVLAVVVSVVAFPVVAKKTNHAAGIAWQALSAPACLVFMGTVILYVAISAVWGYMERLGVSVNIETIKVSEIIGLGYLISIAGSLIAPVVSAYLGRAWTMLLALAVMLLCFLGLGLMEPATALTLYFVTTIAFQFFWSFVLPPLMATFNDVDDSGRLIVLCSPAFKIGEIIGPPLAAYWIVGSNYIPVLWLGAVCASSGVLLLSYVAFTAKK